MLAVYLLCREVESDASKEIMSQRGGGGEEAVCCGVELYSQDSGDTGRQISEACLVYRASFRIAGSTQRNYVPKK